MPFNGEGSHYQQLKWTHSEIVRFIQQAYPDLQRESDPAHSTASHYRIPGANGNIGIIAAFSRTFCGTCNRIRVTAQGELKTCLYDDGVLNIKTLMRDGWSNEEIKLELRSAFSSRPKDGFEAERNRKKGIPINESMSTIGG
jgi:molybdenum cofactor biosynthesis enzyme MoaA